MAKSSLHVSGSLAGLILAVLDEAPLHGYGIAREIVRRSEEALSFGEGTLYPALKTLELTQLIQGRWETFSERGPARKVYEITPEGRKELTRIRVAWHEYSRSIERVLRANADLHST